MTVLELTNVSIAGDNLNPYKVYTMTITGSILSHSVTETFDLEIFNPCSDPLLSEIFFSGDAP